MKQVKGLVVEIPDPGVVEVLSPKSFFCSHGGPLGIRKIEDRRHLRIRALNIVGAKTGDRVRLALRPGRALLALFLLWVLPLIGLLAGALIGMLLGSYLPIHAPPNLLAALLGLGLMAGCFVLVRIGCRAVPADLFMPELIEILPAEELLEEEYRHGD
ncbi:MAG: SoxR reducing system RseC family protein [Syntrophotaleaceae bacterium]